MQRVTVHKKKRKIQHPELFPEGPLPGPLEAEETKDEELVALNRMRQRNAAAKVASDEKSSE